MTVAENVRHGFLGAAGSRVSGAAAEIVPFAFEGRSPGRSAASHGSPSTFTLDLQAMVIPERDHCRLIEAAGRAERFKEWLVGEVLPAIHRHQGNGNCGSAIASLRHRRGAEVMPASVLGPLASEAASSPSGAY